MVLGERYRSNKHDMFLFLSLPLCRSTKMFSIYLQSKDYQTIKYDCKRFHDIKDKGLETLMESTPSNNKKA